jgi:putative phosphonate metabolism protein
MSARYAVYFVPPADDPLSRSAAAWLGRDAFTGAVLAPPQNPHLSQGEIAYHAAPARRYGFHATMKAPFSLAGGETEASLVNAFTEFCAEQAPIDLPGLRIGQIDGFFALLPQTADPALERFAGEVVTAFEPFRAPTTDAEIERRNPDALTPVQLRYLCRWGYPHVFDQFRFHMTLTGRVGGAERERVARALDAHFAPALTVPFAIASLALFVEPEAGAPLSVLSFRPFRMAADRKTA